MASRATNHHFLTGPWQLGQLLSTGLSLSLSLALHRHPQELTDGQCIVHAAVSNHGDCFTGSEMLAATAFLPGVAVLAVGPCCKAWSTSRRISCQIALLIFKL